MCAKAILASVCVFPVPGGPQTNVMGCSCDIWTAISGPVIIE